MIPERLLPYVRSVSDLQAQTRNVDRPTLLLSASVAYEHPVPPHLKPHDQTAFRQAGEPYLRDLQPARIRSAVVELTRTALGHGWRIAFGAHPAISPMVLVVARDMRAPAGSVLIYQSRFFERELPNSTLERAAWEGGGWLVMTDACDGPTEAARRDASLTLMREAMAYTPGLRGAAFVGGMQGVEEEAGLLALLRPDLPRYTIASTGSAARKLWEEHRQAFGTSRVGEAVLEHNPAYSVVARRIFDDMTERDSLD